MLDLRVSDLVPLATALFGFLLGGVSALLRNVRERRKAADEVIFILLKLRVEIRRQNPNLLLGLMRDFMIKKFGKDAEKVASSPDLRIVLTNAIRQSSQQHFETLLKKLDEKILRLAPYRPILAFRISGNEVGRYQAFVDSYYESALQSESVRGDVTGTEVLSVMRRDTLDLITEDALRTVASDLRSVARASSWWRWITVALAVRRQDRFKSDRSKNELYKEWETPFDEMIQKAIQVALSISNSKQASN